LLKNNICSSEITGENREVQLTVIRNCDWWEVHSLCNDYLLDSQQRRQQLSVDAILYFDQSCSYQLDVSLLLTLSVLKLLAHTALSRLIFTSVLRGLLHMTSLLKLVYVERIGLENRGPTGAAGVILAKHNALNATALHAIHL